MQLGILSDTHDKLARTRVAVAQLVDAGAEALVHCGDITTPEIVRACGVAPACFVFGNNDDDQDGLRQAMDEVNAVCLGWGGVATFDGKRVAVTHGHLPRETRRLVGYQPDYLCFGHSHVALDRRDGPTRWINPGALHNASGYSVALLDLETDELRFLAVARHST